MALHGELDAMVSGWFNAGDGLIVAKSSVLLVSLAKSFQFDLVEPAAAQATFEPGEPSPAYWPTASWQSATPEQQGMDSAQLAEALDFLQRRNLNLQRLMLIRNGYLVLDAPIYSPAGEQPYDREAVPRSFLSALLGIAIDQGIIQGLDQPVLDFFPGREIQNRDAQKEAMTLEHLLTMTAGLECKTDPQNALKRAAMLSRWTDRGERSTLWV